MIRAIMHGCMGHMGQVITELAKKDDALEIVAGVDIQPGNDMPYPVFPSLAACDAAADVVIDFSCAAAVDALLADCVAKQLPCVLCTTGLSEEQLAAVERASEKVAILRSANMSVGINLLMKLIEAAAPVLTDAGFDIEIVEKHHNQKLDAPSGTAVALAEKANEVLGGTYHNVYDRSDVRRKRDPKEIGISAVRGGTIVGIHDVIFAGQDEVITLNHTAYSKAIFAKGAIQAARFLAGKPAGRYEMKDIM